jgi:hypothetical protein
MALIACEDCKKEISSRAAACPHCGCPVPQVDEVEGVSPPSNAPGPNPIPEVKVRIDMPPGLGAATASAIKSAAGSEAWGRLYLTLRAIAVVWLVGFGIGAVFLYNDAETRTGARLRELFPESGLVQLIWKDSTFDFIESVPQSEARGRLQTGSYRLATAEEIERETERRRKAIDSEPLFAGAAMVGAGLAPLGILVALRRWWGWLKASP